MSAFEGLLMGLGGAVSVLPGVSAIGAANAVASVCGAERVFALNMTYLMHMVLTVGLIAFDVAAVFAAGAISLTVGSLIVYVLACAAAFAGTAGNAESICGAGTGFRICSTVCSVVSGTCPAGIRGRAAKCDRLAVCIIWNRYTGVPAVVSDGIHPSQADSAAGT